MEKAKEKRKFLTIFSILIMLAITILAPSFFTNKTAYATTGPPEEVISQVIDLDKTRVMDDLLSAENFNILNYPFDQSEDKMVLVNFIEYCYSYKLDSQDNYGLYIYVYNPQGINIDTTKTNKIQMAVEFDSELNPINYEKFELEFCDKSQGAYADLFYKFKIKNVEYFLNILNSLERYYYVSGIELQVNDKPNATEYNVSTLYTYKGYAKGFGGNSEESTLECVADSFDTISLNVNHTVFRTGSPNDQYLWESNQINSVYFSVPNSYLEKYGNLNAIHAEWYEYLTKKIFVTSNKELYNAINPYIGVNINSSSNKPNFTIGSGYVDIAIGGAGVYYTSVYNPFDKLDVGPSAEVIDTINYLFSSNGVSGKYIINSEELSNYIYNYDSSFNTGTIDVNNRKISADLFVDLNKFNSIYQGSRTMGYNNIEISIEDSLKISTITQNNWWDRLWGNDKTITSQNISPIAIVENDILSLKDSEAINKYFISESDLENIKNYYKQETESGSTVFLFRFANTNYKSQVMTVEKHWSLIKPNETSFPTVSASQNVFLDFDIIDLTFSNDSTNYIIPVVSSPIDVIPDIEVNIPKQNNWWIWLVVAFAIIVLLIALPVLLPLLTILFQLLIWIIILPFKFIGWIFNLIFKRRKKNE